MTVTSYSVRDLKIHVGDEESITALETSSATNFSRFSTSEFDGVGLDDSDVLAKFDRAGTTVDEAAPVELLEQLGSALWASKWHDVSAATVELQVKNSEKYGQLDIPGRPYLHQLLAEQRSAVRMPLTEETLTELRRLADEKLQELRFAVAGWTSANDAELPGKIKRNWEADLALLAAAEEILGLNGFADVEHRATRWQVLKIFREGVDKLGDWTPGLRGRLVAGKVDAARATLNTVLVVLTGEYTAVAYVVEPEEELIELSPEEMAAALGDGFRERLNAVQNTLENALDNEAQLKQQRRSVERTLSDAFANEEFDSDVVRTELIDYALMRVLVKVDGRNVDFGTLGDRLSQTITGAEGQRDAVNRFFGMIENPAVRKTAEQAFSFAMDLIQNKHKELKSKSTPDTKSKSTNLFGSVNNNLPGDAVEIMSNFVQQGVVKVVLARLDWSIDKAAKAS